MARGPTALLLLLLLLLHLAATMAEENAEAWIDDESMQCVLHLSSPCRACC